MAKAMAIANTVASYECKSKVKSYLNGRGEDQGSCKDNFPISFGQYKNKKGGGGRPPFGGLPNAAPLYCQKLKSNGELCLTRPQSSRRLFIDHEKIACVGGPLGKPRNYFLHFFLDISWL